MSNDFNWDQRTCQEVLCLPFTEGLPSPSKIEEMHHWLKLNSDKYARKYVKLYHATCPSIPIESEGLKPTSAIRRRSLQSESGYVYLAVTPERAKLFGDLGNQSKSVVYEVIVPIKALKPDKDQIRNMRLTGRAIKSSVSSSIIETGCVRIKGKIESWAIRKYTADNFIFQKTA